LSDKTYYAEFLINRLSFIMQTNILQYEYSFGS